MRIYLQSADGQWLAPYMENGDNGDPFPDGFAEKWAEAVAVTVGLPEGSLQITILKGDEDPRKGVLIEDPNKADVPLPNKTPTLDEQVASLDQRMGVVEQKLGIPPVLQL